MLILLVVSGCCFASGSVSAGPFFGYDPMDANLFNPDNLTEKTNFNYGVSAQIAYAHCSFTTDVRLNSLDSENFKLQTLSFANLRMNLGKYLFWDVGMGVEISLDKAVEDSDKLYLTTGEMLLSEVLPFVSSQGVKYLGMFRLRQSFGFVLDPIAIRLDLTINPRTMIMLYPESTLKDFIGIHDVTLALMYRVL